jgi:hypothetical protein
MTVLSSCFWPLPVWVQQFVHDVGSSSLLQSTDPELTWIFFAPPYAVRRALNGRCPLLMVRPSGWLSACLLFYRTDSGLFHGGIIAISGTVFENTSSKRRDPDHLMTKVRWGSTQVGRALWHWMSWLRRNNALMVCHTMASGRSPQCARLAEVSALTKYARVGNGKACRHPSIRRSPRWWVCYSTTGCYAAWAGLRAGGLRQPRSKTCAGRPIEPVLRERQGPLVAPFSRSRPVAGRCQQGLVSSR